MRAIIVPPTVMVLAECRNVPQCQIGLLEALADDVVSNLQMAGQTGR